MILQDVEALTQVGARSTTVTKIFVPLLRNAKLTLLPERLVPWRSKHFEPPLIIWPVHGLRT
jgi:hypothetical protein